MEAAMRGTRAPAARAGGKWILAAAAAVFGLGLGTAGDLGAQETRPGGGAGEPSGTPAQAAVLTLPEAVRLAIDRSRDLQSARYTLEEAEEQVDEAWGAVFPKVDLTANYTRNVSPSVSFVPAIFLNPEADPDDLLAVRFGADNTWSNQINVEQVLFDPAAFIGVGAAGRFYDLQEEMVRGTEQDVVTRVRTTYYNLLLAQEQVRLTEESLERVRRSLEETRALHKAGLSSDYDVLRLEVELANLEPNLRRAENAVVAARRQLAVELDVEDPESIRVAGSLATIDLDDPGANDPANREILAFGGVPATPAAAADPAAMDALVTAGVERRPDVRQAELDESLRQTELRVEQSDYLPRVTLFGTYGINSQQNGRPDFFGDPRAYSRFVGVTVTLPIFTGLQRESRIGQRRAAVREARARTELTRDVADAEVRDLADAVEEALHRARAQGFAVEQAERGFEIAQAQYREGLSSQLELTDAEVALRESEFNYAQAVYDYLNARAQLDRATGSVPLVSGA